VRDERHTLRVCRIADVEQETVAAARAAGEADRRIHRDVMALRRALSNARCPSAPTAGAAAARSAAGGRTTAAARGTIRVLDAVLTRARVIDWWRAQILEDVRLAHAFRLLWMGHRHLDHFNPERRGVRAVLRRKVRASAELALRAHAR